MEPNKATPPIVFSRNEHGLLVGDNSPSYVFNQDGGVDWRKMIDSKWLVPNKQRTKETDISKLEDKELLILLPGIKKLAKIRGYDNVSYQVTCPSPDAVIAVCSISFLPNYETEGKAVSFSAIGDATAFNTNSFGRNFLGPIAENRAFVRCVRNFLGINIVGYEEVDQSAEASKTDAPDKPESSSAPNETMGAKVLQDEMNIRGIKLEHIIARLKEEHFEGTDSIKTLSDIPGHKILELIMRIKKVPVKAS